jgi:methyl-accepting chemotaxis protein
MERNAAVLNNLRISTRLKFMIAVPLLVLLAISLLGWHGMKGTTAGLKEVYEDRSATRHLGVVTADMYRVRMVLMTAMAVEDAKEVERLAKGLDGRIESIRKSWAAYLEKAATPEEKALSQAVGQELEKLLGTVFQPAIKALQAGDLAGAKKISMQQDNRAMTTKVREGLDRLDAMLEKASRQQYETAVSSAGTVNVTNLAALVCATVLLTLFGWRVMRAITVPVAAMQRALVEAQRANDLTQRVEVKSGDEIGQMARAFNSLMETLQGTLKKVVDGAHEVSSAAAQMATASSQITQSARVQSESAASTAAAVEQVTVSIGQVAESTRETRVASEQACQLSQAGEKTARDTASQMMKTADSVGQSMQLIENLSRRSNEISGIVKVIRDIAEQTNLLALNAAIEAARAGEQGRGFAVVADEVRKLAERTSTSTSEIAAMIEAIQGEVHSAVGNLKANNEQVAQGRGLAEEVAALLTRINDGARSTMQRIHDISSAASEQTTASTAIAKNVERVAQMTEETSAAAGQASTVADQLESLASKLHGEVARFRIERAA